MQPKEEAIYITNLSGVCADRARITCLVSKSRLFSYFHIIEDHV